jgi:hypothetical protein
MSIEDWNMIGARQVHGGKAAVAGRKKIIKTMLRVIDTAVCEETVLQIMVPRAAYPRLASLLRNTLAILCTCAQFSLTVARRKARACCIDCSMFIV